MQALPFRLPQCAVIALFLLLALASGAWAQQLGTPEFHQSLRSRIDSIYSANLDVQFEHTVVSKRGRGIPFYLQRVYHSSVYHEGYGQFGYSPNGGWTDVTPAGSISWTTSSNTCSYFDDVYHQTVWETYYFYSGYTFYDPNGVLYGFNLTLHTGNDCTSANLNGTATSGPYTLHVSNGYATVTGPGGKIYSTASSWPVKDANGNYLSTSQPNGSETDWTDTTGQVVLKEVTSTTGCVNPVNGQSYPKCVSYLTPDGDGSGGWSTYEEFDQTISVNSGANCSGITDYSGTATVPVYAVLPEYLSGDTSAYYQYGYDSAGRLNYIRFPQGGTASYTYGSLCTYGDGTPDSVTRTDNDNNGHSSMTTYSRPSSTETTMVRNTDGSKVVVTYNSSGLPTDVKSYDAGGSTLLTERSTNYDSSGYPSGEFDYSNGVETREIVTGFDTYGNLHTRTVYDLTRDPGGTTAQTTTIDYETGSSYINLGLTALPTSITVTNYGGAALKQTTIQYDQGALMSVSPAQHDSGYNTSWTARGNPTTISQVNGTSSLNTTLTYDTAGDLLSTTDPNGHVVTIGYGGSSCNNSYPTSVTAPGGTASYTWDCMLGNQLSSTDVNGRSTSFTYDQFGRLSEVARPDGGTTTTSYPNSNTVEVDTAVDGSQVRKEQTVTDGLGQTILTGVESAAQPSPAWDVVETVYDAFGHPTGVSNPYSSSSVAAPASAAYTTRGYDGLARLVAVTKPDGSTTQYQYNATAVQVTDPRGVKRILETDGLGKLWKVCEVSGQTGNGNCGLSIAGNGFLTTYTYDMAGRLTNVSQNGNSRSWAYDELGRVTSRTDPESGLTTYTYDSVSDPACPNSSSVSAGDLVLTADASGMKTCLQYDAWHRLITKAFSTGQTYTYTWDGSQANNSLGRLVSAGDASVTDSFVYDVMGRAASVTESIAGAGSYTTSYAYNYLGEPTVVGAPSGSSARSIDYNYDLKGRLTAASDPSSGVTYAGNMQFNSADQITLAHFGGSALQFGATYNNDLQPNFLNWTSGSGVTMNLQYGWGASYNANTGDVTSGDDNGTLRQLSDTISNTTRSVSYSYDDMNRLLSVTDNSIQTSFSIDPEGTLYSTTYSNEPSTNRLTGLTYDGAGRVTAGTWGGITGRQLSWDPAGEMLSYADANTSTISYIYDAFGRRVKAASSGSVSYYYYGAGSGDHPIVENLNGTWHTNVLVNGQVIATVATSGNATYLAANMLGTTKMLVDASGAEIGSEATYFPYGDQKATLGTEYAFTNQIRDANNIDHFWMRSYSPDLGRWLTPDPAGMAAVDPANPQTWNRYAYVGNNPTALTDPFGLFGTGPCPVGQEYVDTSAGTTQCEPKGGGPNPLDPTGVYFGSSGSGGGGVPIPLITAKIPSFLVPSFCADAPPDVPLTPESANLNANIHNSAEVASLDPSPGGISSLIWFYGQVATGGPWDYKQYGAQFVDFGNFNYGATCGAMGRSLSFCQSAAGLGHVARYAKLKAESPFTGRHPTYGGAGLPFLLTPYGDQPADDAAIAMGYIYGLWRENCG